MHIAAEVSDYESDSEEVDRVADPEEFQAYGVRLMLCAHQCMILVHLAFNIFIEGTTTIQVTSKTTGDAAVFKGLSTFGCNKVGMPIYILCYTMHTCT